MIYLTIYFRVLLCSFILYLLSVYIISFLPFTFEIMETCIIAFLSHEGIDENYTRPLYILYCILFIMVLYTNITYKNYMNIMPFIVHPIFCGNCNVWLNLLNILKWNLWLALYGVCIEAKKKKQESSLWNKLLEKYQTKQKRPGFALNCASYLLPLMSGHSHVMSETITKSRLSSVYHPMFGFLISFYRGGIFYNAFS